MAVLFGCPLWMVDELVPAQEKPLWQVHFEQEPWGFSGMDKLFSKSALQIAQATGSVKTGVCYQDLMFVDRFESLQLTDQEITRLSEQERIYYQHKSFLKRFRDLGLTADEFNQLSPAEQRDYSTRQVAQMKRVLSNGEENN